VIAVDQNSLDYLAGRKQGFVDAMAKIAAAVLSRRNEWRREIKAQRSERLAVAAREECVIRASEDDEILSALGLALGLPPALCATISEPKTHTRPPAR